MKPTYTYEAQACNCVLPSTSGHKGCGEDCINRMVYSECSPQLCPCKEFCSNQRIQRHEWAPGLEKFMTKDKVESLCFHSGSLRSPSVYYDVRHLISNYFCWNLKAAAFPFLCIKPEVFFPNQLTKKNVSVCYTAFM